MRIQRVAPALAAAVMLLAACTSGGEGGRPGATTGPTYHPTGQVVVLAGRFLGRITVVDAATGKERRLPLPIFGGAWENAWPGEDGTFYAMPLVFNQNSRNQLYRLGVGKRPERVGPSIAGVASYQVRAGYVVTWGCPGPTSLLDLSDPSRWTTIGHACSATISPDGSRLAYATATALYVMDLPNGRPREVLRFRDLSELHRARIQPRSLDEMLWGAPGVALAVGDAARSALVVWRDDGPPVVHPLGRARMGQMQWQPGGRLLAFFDYAPHGEVLTLDPDTNQQRQLTATGEFGRLAWSPDGKTVATSRSENTIALVDPNGRGQLGTLSVPGVPIVWLAE